MGSISSLSNFLSSGATLGSTTAASITQALESDLAGAPDDSSNNLDSSFLLDLSPTAQSLLSGSSGSTGSSTSSSSNFTLTTAQQTEISNILEKYKNSPFDQATFNSILTDLDNAGLSPDQLAAADQSQSFNATNVLLQALSGNYSSLSTPSSASDEQTKTQNYLRGIVSQWQSLSSTFSSSSFASSSLIPAT